ncbi:50S ribosomal protein L25 [Phenylobacterium sp. Root77]|jgi:large subunit ribosomal protein L25|uniref:50S ribosomal protein L25/general stress protein Ctc n=1 Tax=unclassified Phenylobacterium TaxID=2640670 RepID=UPI0006F45378|nr:MULTISPECIES: 50S ribosomal protein L25/general stress protein Ctc [unclassified Phenylobacterium]KQW73049.1 50S ribosomal protein L25 [Phenylobacterium sp. Root1277]KQW92269.1 50S ribosomal protein L25 [Phenylobacterium sp. Root1290]KRC40500.1 50S ribosomal protein L25 [Phenylobacterium sp. Root77]
MADIILNVELRERIGTGGARAARREGLVPGVLYGGDKDPVAITVKSNEFRKALYTGKLLGHLVTLKHGKETQPVIAKVVDMHPVTDEPIHFDLYRVDAHQTIKIAVPVHFKNHEASPGLKKGGTLNVVRHDVELQCHADAIPEELVFDLTGLDIGDTIRISAFTLPKGVEAAMDRDFVVATVAGSSASASEAAEEAANEAEA